MAPPKKWEEEESSSEEETSSDESVEAKPIVVAARRKFEDEEDSDDAPDNWDEDDSEAEREKETKAAAAKAKADAEAAANKKTKSQRIEEHREAQRRKKLEEDDESSEDEDEAEKRARLRESEKKSDLKHAEDLIGDMTLGSKRTTTKAVLVEDKNNPGQAIDLSQMSLFKPATKTQFEELSKVLIPLLTAQSAKPQYSLWAATFVKAIVSDLPSTEIKKVASVLTAQSNEKLKEEREKDKGTKKTKAAKSKTTLTAGRDVGRGIADTTAYDDDGMGDDDFM